MTHHEMKDIEQQSNALWQQQFNNEVIGEQFWQRYEGLITQARLLAKKKLVKLPTPLDYTAKRLMTKYWQNDLPEFYDAEGEEPGDGFSISWSLVGTLLALLGGTGALFMGFTELAVGCMMLAIGLMSAKILTPAPKQLLPTNKREVKVVLEPQYLVYHFRNKPTEAYQSIKINYTWIADLREEDDSFKLIGHKNQDTWQVSFSGKQSPIILPKRMMDTTYLKYFLQDLIKQRTQPKTSLIPSINF